MSGNLYGSFIRVRENRIIMTNEPIMPYCRKPRLRENLTIDRKDAYSGYLSVNAGKTIEKRLTCWFNSMFVINRDCIDTGKVREFMPVMLTCTLSQKQVHDDKWIKRNILQEFLKALGRKRDIRFTFWKAEAQLNGNIHFHILIDRYIDMKFVQGLWNYYQKKAGYLDLYFNKYGSYNAPSTKLTGMKSNKSPISYVLKYVQKKGLKPQHCKMTQSGCLLVCKQLENVRRPIEGAVFRFSAPLISLVPPTIYADMDLQAHFRHLESQGKFRFVPCDYCNILYCVKCKAVDLLLPYYKKELDDYYRDVFDALYRPQPPILYCATSCSDPVKCRVNEQLSFFDDNHHNVTILN